MLTLKTFRFDVKREVQALRCDRCETCVPRFPMTESPSEVRLFHEMGVPDEQLHAAMDWLHLELGGNPFDFCPGCLRFVRDALVQVATARRGA